MNYYLYLWLVIWIINMKIFRVCYVHIFVEVSVWNRKLLMSLGIPLWWDFFLFAIVSRLTVGSPSFLSSRYWGGGPLHPPLYSAKVKNVWSHTSTHLCNMSSWCSAYLSTGTTLSSTFCFISDYTTFYYCYFYIIILIITGFVNIVNMRLL